MKPRTEDMADLILFIDPPTGKHHTLSGNDMALVIEEIREMGLGEDIIFAVSKQKSTQARD